MEEGLCQSTYTRQWGNVRIFREKYCRDTRKIRWRLSCCFKRWRHARLMGYRNQRHLKGHSQKSRCWGCHQIAWILIRSIWYPRYICARWIPLLVLHEKSQLSKTWIKKTKSNQRWQFTDRFQKETIEGAHLIIGPIIKVISSTTKNLEYVD